MTPPGVAKIATPGGVQSITVLEEPGIYQLTLSSKMISAKKFQKWLLEEVLPSIRKTGSYSIQKEEPKPLAAYAERVRSMHEDFKNIPKDHWCILHESANLLIWIESVMGYPVDRADIVDISIGKTWAEHRKNKSWTKDRIQGSYKFPKGIQVAPWTYHYDELPHFKRFMEDLYKPKYLPKYLESKYGKLAKFQKTLFDLL